MSAILPSVSGSAIPPWLSQALPAWFLARPATTEALWAASVAFGKSAVTVLYTLWVGYSVLTPSSELSLIGYLAVIKAGWFAVAAPVLWGYYNGGIAQKKAAAAAKEP